MNQTWPLKIIKFEILTNKYPTSNTFYKDFKKIRLLLYKNENRLKKIKKEENNSF